MKYIECPANFTGAGPDVGLFLGGGITECPDWQSDLVKKLSDTDLTLLNPRRVAWDASIDPRDQILWEYKHMLRSDAITFWFCKATLCPIVLFELGSWLEKPKKLFIGCEEGYERIFDVQTQVGLVRPCQVIHSSLNALASEVLAWYEKKKMDCFARLPDQPEPKSPFYYDPRFHREN